MITIIDLRKKFNERWITNGVTLTIPAGQMTVIIGKSGEGKSVFLKQVMGLIKPTSGSIIIDGININTTDLKAARAVLKQCGYVFQFAALLDSLTIFENIGITLLEQGMPVDKVRPLVQEKVALVNLKEDILDKHPSEISGGMQKRVGLARTLLTNPRILLYDEPTTGLDPITVRIIHELMLDMQHKLHITSLVVSHDIEIFNYADNVALLDKGTIRYVGSAKNIWACEDPYVYQFIRGLTQGPIT